MAAHGEWNHIEIPADDPERAKRFYEAVAGWQFTTMDGFPDYSLYRSGPADLGGGLGIRAKTAPAGNIRSYLNVDSIDAAIAAVEANGGKVVTPKVDMGIGSWAAVLDTEGNEIGLYEAKPQG
jgi:predicted enzyme related to lactoylglutathione lyase